MRRYLYFPHDIADVPFGVIVFVLRHGVAAVAQGVLAVPQQVRRGLLRHAICAYSAVFQRLALIFLVMIGNAVTFCVPAFATENENIAWFETPIAEVTVGYDPRGHIPRQRTFYLALVGPKKAVTDAGIDPGASMTVARQCAEATVKPLGATLTNQLKYAIATRQAGLSQTGQVKADVDAANKALAAVALNDPGNFYQCASSKHAAIVGKAGFYTAIVQRDCIPSKCPLSGSRLRLSNDPETAWFGLLYEWVASKGAIEQREPGLQFRLNTLTDANRAISLTADVAPADEPVSNQWAPALSEHDAAIQFGALAELVRASTFKNKAAPKISSYAGVVAKIDKADYLKIADALDRPVDGYTFIASASAGALVGISNEIARARISDCHFFRGLNTKDELNSCAGLAVDDATLQSCISGATCEPAIPDSADTVAILLNAPHSLTDLATANPFSRPMPGHMADLVTQYNQCAGMNSTDAGIIKCVGAGFVSADPQSKAMIGCVALGDDQTRVGCAIKAFGGGLGKAGRCVDTELSRSAECLTASYLPPATQQAYVCVGKSTQGARLACLAGMAGGTVGHVAGCAASTNDQLALAVCIGGDKLPPNVQAGVACLAEQGVSVENVGICAMKTQLPPQYAMAIGCVTQSNGSPLGAAACVAASTLNLTPNQRLALQCLASTGGQPYAFAICFGGTLTMQELTKCKGKGFGEGDCFGHNNEIQKLANALTGHDISSNSVVGQVTTVGLVPAEYVVGLVQPVFNDVMKIPGAAIDNIKASVDDVKQIVQGNVWQGATGLAGEAIQDMLTPAKILGIKIKLF